MAIQRNVPDIESSEQTVLNRSVDKKYDVIAVELLTENQAGTALDRVKTSAMTDGGDTISSGQVSVATTETQIVASRSGRKGVLITNLGTTDVYVGPTGLTTATGSLILGTKGTALFIPTTAAIYGRVAAGTQSVSYLEVYNA